MPNEEPIRVLSIVGGGHLGGVEVWMLDVLSHIDRNRFDVDVMTTCDTFPADYEQQVRARNGRVIHCPSRSRRLGPLSAAGFGVRLRRVLREFGPYDVVHDNGTMGFLGPVTFVALLSGVPVRILHARSMIDPGFSRANIKRVLSWPMVTRTTTHFLGVSRHAAMSIFHRKIVDDSRFSLSTGINISQFDPSVAVAPARTSLGIGEHTKVVGHVGRFSEEKRHDLWVRVALRIAESRDDVAFLLVGDGPLRSEIESQVRASGRADQFHFVGNRPDVADLIRTAMDVLLFPSRYEGLPRVPVEAQSAGLPCVISDAITPEVDVVPSLVRRHSLVDPPEAWAQTVIDVLDGGPPLSQPEAFALVAASPLNIATSIKALERIYETARSPSGALHSQH